MGACAAERHVSRVSVWRQVAPLVNYVLSIYIKPHAIVYRGGEAVCACRKVDRPRPAGREIVRARTAVRTGAVAAEVYVEEVGPGGTVVTRHRRDALESLVVEILSLPPVCGNIHNTIRLRLHPNGVQDEDAGDTARVALIPLVTNPQRHGLALSPHYNPPPICDG